jgi:hypothetical protein
MLMHQTLSKGWSHARSRLLLDLIVRPRGRLVEGLTLLRYAKTRPSGLASRLGSTYPGLAEPSAAYHVLDTTLIPAIVRVRASRKGLFCGQASFGRSASKTEWVYGFKVGLTVSPQGVITAFGVAEVVSEERPIADWLIRQDRHELYLADKGFACVGWERHWAYEQGSLVVATPKDNSKRAWSRSPLGGRQTPDHRGGHRSAQGHLRSGAPPGQDVGRGF